MSTAAQYNNVAATATTTSAHDAEVLQVHETAEQVPGLLEGSPSAQQSGRALCVAATSCSGPPASMALSWMRLARVLVTMTTTMLDGSYGSPAYEPRGGGAQKMLVHNSAALTAALMSVLMKVFDPTDGSRNLLLNVVPSMYSMTRADGHTVQVGVCSADAPLGTDVVHFARKLCGARREMCLLQIELCGPTLAPLSPSQFSTRGNADQDLHQLQAALLRTTLTEVEHDFEKLPFTGSSPDCPNCPLDGEVWELMGLRVEALLQAANWDNEIMLEMFKQCGGIPKISKLLFNFSAHLIHKSPVPVSLGHNDTGMPYKNTAVPIGSALEISSQRYDIHSCTAIQKNSHSPPVARSNYVVSSMQAATGVNSARSMQAASGVNSARSMQAASGVNSARSMQAASGVNSARSMQAASGVNSARSMQAASGVNSARSMQAASGVNSARS
eukprot:Lankesteria_metandrocarpae@DN3156_c0_g1_i1.p1